jgi:hypothetical protein
VIDKPQTTWWIFCCGLVPFWIADGREAREVHDVSGFAIALLITLKLFQESQQALGYVIAPEVW